MNAEANHEHVRLERAVLHERRIHVHNTGRRARLKDIDRVTERRFDLAVAKRQRDRPRHVLDYGNVLECALGELLQGRIVVALAGSLPETNHAIAMNFVSPFVVFMIFSL